MTDNSGEMLAEIWVALKPYLDKKERQDAAHSFIRVAEDYINLEVQRDDLAVAGREIAQALTDLIGDVDYEDDDEEDENY